MQTKSERRLTFNSKLAKIINKDIEACHSDLISIKNNQNRCFKIFNKVKSNISLILQFIIFIICLIGFINQASKLTIDYFSYETIVKLKYETDKESVLPGTNSLFSIPFNLGSNQIQVSRI